MPRTLQRVRGGLALLLFAGGLAVGSTGLRGESSPPSTIHLDATLVSPIDVVLKWNDASPVVATHIIEYATNPAGPYIILNFCPPSQTTYKHPNLMPQTTFYYRVRAIYGPTTDPVEVTLPASLSDADYADRYAKPEDYSWTAPKILPDPAPIKKKSIRDAATAAAAPTDFKATFVPTTVSGFQFTWTNHSSDEEGFFLETKEAGSPDFTICAKIAPKTNAFGWGFHPPQRKASFRIRAYYFGTPSNLENETTVLPSAWKKPTAQLATPSKPGH
ncbi:MAG TPA: fibronectin type III domain-containing protein [Opitutaceae bacterium]|nr:fibronectin type III domain-containing protein [Opitutaceae bacterium]